MNIKTIFTLFIFIIIKIEKVNYKILVSIFLMFEDVNSDLKMNLKMMIGVESEKSGSIIFKYIENITI